MSSAALNNWEGGSAEEPGAEAGRERRRLLTLERQRGGAGPPRPRWCVEGTLQHRRAGSRFQAAFTEAQRHCVSALMGIRSDEGMPEQPYQGRSQDMSDGEGDSVVKEGRGPGTLATVKTGLARRSSISSFS